jgi:periplasmic protein TonB
MIAFACLPVILITPSRDDGHLCPRLFRRRCIWTQWRCGRLARVSTIPQLWQVLALNAEVAMQGTIEIHEPEVQEVKPAGRPAALEWPRREMIPPPALAQRALFSDSLLEFGAQRRRKTFATLSSFLLNVLAIGTLLVLPLYFTEELPKAQLLTFLLAPPPPPPPPPPASQQMAKVLKQIQTDMLSNGGLRTPTRIPQKVQMIREEEAPPPMAVSGGVVGGVPGGIPGGQLGGVIGGIVAATSNLSAVPKLVLATPQRVRISQGVTKGLLIHSVQPPYPVLARAARVQGDVVLRAIIDKNGNIQDLQLISGHPMLVPSAIEAVKQWRYKPYLLNGSPVEVDTTITVIFALTT